MPTSRVKRTIDADLERVWGIVGDPRSLPRWWPLVTRVEGVMPGRFTQVLASPRGREVRADCRVTADDRAKRRAWSLDVEGSPFERLLTSSVTEVRMERADGATRVEIELRQRLRGLARFGGFLTRRAGRKQLRKALDGLEEALAPSTGAPT